MRNKKVLFIILGLLIVLVVSLYLNNPPRLDSINPLPTAKGSEPGQNPDPSKEKPPEQIPDVNPFLVKGHGDLAFVSRGLLYMIDGSTGELRQLTESGQAFYPRWSYDGKYLAFIRITDTKSSSGTLWIVGRDGKGAHQVQGLPQPIGAGDFQWSPANHILAVGSWNVTDGIWLVQLNEKPRQLVKAKNPMWFAWSHDGKRIAYNITEDSEAMGDILYTIGIDDGKTVKRLDLAGTGTGIEAAKWWPDGQGLLYWTNPASHSSSMRADGLQLWTLNLDGGEPKEIDDTLTYREWLDFSPDGKLVMTSGIGRSLWYWKKLALADVKSGEVEYIEPPKGSVAFEPAFSPDGKKMAFIAAQEMDESTFYSEQEPWFESRTLWTADADGSNAKPLIGSKIYSPMWSKDGNNLFYVQDGALWVISVDGGKPQQVLGGMTEEDTWGFYGHIRFSDWFDWFK